MMPAGALPGAGRSGRSLPPWRPVSTPRRDPLRQPIRARGHERAPWPVFPWVPGRDRGCSGPQRVPQIRFCQKPCRKSQGSCPPGRGILAGMARPPPDPALVGEALALAAQTSPEEAAKTLCAAGRRVSSRSIREWQKGRNGAAAALAVEPAEPGPTWCQDRLLELMNEERPENRAAPLEGPPTARDAEIDRLLSTSRTWLRVTQALGRALARYPDAARALACELRAVEL